MNDAHLFSRSHLHRLIFPFIHFTKTRRYFASPWHLSSLTSALWLCRWHNLFAPLTHHLQSFVSLMIDTFRDNAGLPIADKPQWYFTPLVLPFHVVVLTCFSVWESELSLGLINPATENKPRTLLRYMKLFKCVVSMMSVFWVQAPAWGFSVPLDTLAMVYQSTFFPVDDSPPRARPRGRPRDSAK